MVGCYLNGLEGPPSKRESYEFESHTANHPLSAATPFFQISQSERIIDMTLPYNYLMEVQEEGICPQCYKPSKSIDFQFSFGVYAGVMCTNCAISGYRDSCGHKRRPGSPRELEELGETYWEE